LTLSRMADGGWSAFSCCLDKKMKAGSSRHFCLSCRNFSREIINKACQQTLDSLRDTNGNLETGGQDIKELVFSELDKLYSTKFWRSDKLLKQQIIARVEAAVNKPEAGEKEKAALDRWGGFETIACEPDNRKCKRRTNPAYYTLQIESDPTYLEFLLEK